MSLEIPTEPGPRIVPSCHPGWGAVSDLGGSFAECGFKIGHRHCGTTTRAIKTAPFTFQLSFRCFVLILSLCLLSEILAENEKYWLKLLVDMFFAWDEPNLQNSC